MRVTRQAHQLLVFRLKRRIVIFANTDGNTDMARAIADIRREVAGSALPQGFFTSLEGTFQAQEEASRKIGLLSLVSLALEQNPIRLHRSLRR